MLDLRRALQTFFDAQKRVHDRSGVLFVTPPPVIIETFCDGPEVDINLLLWRGEVLHAEVVDNFPARAEQDSTMEAYQATGSLNPSALPQVETDMLKRDIADIVRKLGIHSGAIHAEARVHNSTYCVPSGRFAVRPRVKPQTNRSSTFLLEINPRFGGWPEPMLSRFAHGIDYFAEMLMHVIGDETRFRAFAKGSDRSPNRHYAWVPQSISQEDVGTMPDVHSAEGSSAAEAFVGYRYYWKPGEKVPHKGDRPWPGAGFIILGSEKADDVARTAQMALQEMKITLTP